MSADGRRWYLLNASPDLRAQFESFPALLPQAGRRTPVSTVLLTDAELDHTLGLLLLREAENLELHATAAVHDALRDGSGLLRLLEAYCPVRWHEVQPGKDVSLSAGLRYEAFAAPSSKRARFGTDTQADRVVGYRIGDERSGKAAVYLPAVQQLTAPVLEQLRDCDCLLIDGTCWDDDELIRKGLAGKTARDMGHLPISGDDGSLAAIASLPIRRKIFVHINNTNPILLEDSAERRLVDQCGVEVGTDGLEIRI